MIEELKKREPLGFGTLFDLDFEQWLIALSLRQAAKDHLSFTHAVVPFICFGFLFSLSLILVSIVIR